MPFGKARSSLPAIPDVKSDKGTIQSNYKEDEYMNLVLQLKRYASQDVVSITKKAESLLNKRVFFVIDLPYEWDQVDENTLDVKAHIEGDKKPFSFDIHLTYTVDENDDVYVDTDVDEYVDILVKTYLKAMKGEVKASTKITAAGGWADQQVTAEDDPDSDDTDEPEDNLEGPDDDDTAEVIDDLADAVEDVQDAVDDVQEDDTVIETENNIASHYIAECDVCYGVFVSAVTESDQKIDHISGECPLCGKTTEQYLKWIVKNV